MMGDAVNRHAPKAVPTRKLYDRERWYLERWVEFVAQRATQGVTDPPSVLAFADYVKRGNATIHRMMRNLEALGYLARDPRRHFVMRRGAMKAAQIA